MSRYASIIVLMKITVSLAFNCLRVWGITQQILPTILVFLLSIPEAAVNIVRLGRVTLWMLNTHIVLVQLLLAHCIQSCIEWPTHGMLGIPSEASIHIVSTQLNII